MADGYNHTDNFNLPLYLDNTPADLRDGYNSAMRSIDTNMLNISNGVNTANANVNALKTNLTALGADTPEKATALATDIANSKTRTTYSHTWASPTTPAPVSISTLSSKTIQTL